jgi:hypothetical protein
MCGAFGFVRASRTGLVGIMTHSGTLYARPRQDVAWFLLPEPGKYIMTAQKESSKNHCGKFGIA